MTPAGCPLSRRQLECLHLAARGHTYLQIGRRLRVAAGTVGSYFQIAYRKLGVAGLPEAIAAGYAAGWLQDPPLEDRHRRYMAAFEDWHRDPTSPGKRARRQTALRDLPG
jgi:DNA-binding CsgD family transcriptional regulator